MILPFVPPHADPGKPPKLMKSLDVCERVIVTPRKNVHISLGLDCGLVWGTEVPRIRMRVKTRENLKSKWDGGQVGD